MKYGSVCSGIEAATMAWHGMAWIGERIQMVEDLDATPKP
jgi:hypothetical protein